MSVIFSYGEILWDIFPEYKKPGGSPANLAYHLHVLGNTSNLISRIGEDEHGKELLKFITDKGLSTKFIQTDSIQPTGTVTVHFTGNEPSYTIHKPAAWDYIEMTDELQSALPEADAVCFASLSQREEESANTLQQILKTIPETCLKVFDLNLRPPFTNQEIILNTIEQADVVKFNKDELDMVSDWLDVENLPEYLLRHDPAKKILLTLGGDGSALFTKKGYSEHQAYPISGEGDFVGVGDAFLACITHLLLKGEKGENLLRKANRYAAAVASHKGGMPEMDQISRYLS
jgi:fructokinase